MSDPAHPAATDRNPSRAHDPDGAGWAAATAAALGEWTSDPLVDRAVAVVDDGGTEVRIGPRVAPDSTFAVGSVTKTMTATVLASLHLHDDLDLDTTLGDLLDVPAHGAITLRQLATHASGLPRLAPGTTEGVDPLDPYAGETAETTIAALAHDELAATGLATDRGKPGAAGPAYSNWGYQLLGLALETYSRTPLHQLLHDRIFGPLAMDSTAHRSGPLHRPLVPGRHRGHQVPRWSGTLGGPGFVESTAEDLVRYVRAVLAPTDDAIGAAIRLATDPACRLAWQWAAGPGLLWHNGGEGGATSIVVIDPATRRACIGLAAALADPIEQATVRAIRGADIGSPPSPAPADDDPAWTALTDAVGAIRVRDVDRIISLLAPAYRDHPSVADIPDELTGLGSVGADIRRLPGRPAAISVALNDRPDDCLLLVADGETGLLAGFVAHPVDQPPPW